MCENRVLPDGENRIHVEKRVHPAGEADVRRRKEPRLIAAFPAAADAMAVEKACTDRGFPGRLIPLPPSISAGCGLCWCTDLSERNALSALLDELGVRGAALHECEIWVLGTE